MTKEQLRAYRDLKTEHDLLSQKLEELETELYGIQAQRLDGMPHSNREGSSDKTDILLDRKTLLHARYMVKKVELAKAVLAIEDAIEKLTPRERTLIRLYYIDGLTWEQVAVKMNYSWRQVHRIHGAALAQLKTNEEATE